MSAAAPTPGISGRVRLAAEEGQDVSLNFTNQVIASPRRRRAIALAAAVGITVGTALAIGAPAVATPEESTPELELPSGNYVVVLAEQPAATYDGGVSGLSATEPDKGEGLRSQSSAVREYREHLKNKQKDVANTVDAEPEQQYTVSINAFSAELSGTQAAKLQGKKGVLAVVPDEALHLDTYKSPEFLGLSGDGGVWDDLGGPNDAGHGVVVGVLDSGIWPENPSFAGDPLSASPSGEIGDAYRTSATDTAVLKANGQTFAGECEEGENWTADLCNQKIVSARYFADGFLANVPPENRSEFEHISARDGAGHGSHTSSTAAGNNDVPMSVNDREFGNGSGMAPGAKIATYKVCWEDTDPDTGGCYFSDILAAIDQAVLDGVDVINYSISGSLTSSLDPVELAFLAAANANVFVAASAGNSGPGSETVAHNSPWLTTVAATTHFNYQGTVELGDGSRFRGEMISNVGVPDAAPLIYAGDIPAEGVDPAEAALCAPNSLADGSGDGAVVLCDRGTYARVAKSEEAARVGAVGSILANVNPGESLNADIHAVPTVHVDSEDGNVIRDYISSASNPTAALLPGDQTGLDPAPVPVVAGFSSRGPALANGGDLLKPDIGAPGNSVLAAVAPGPNNGNDFNFISGTSMSSPHIAGLAALIKGERTDWTPMEVKSAMMTTARDLRTPDDEKDKNHFNSGSGNVDPTKFLDPGLLYDSDVEDWLAFLEGAEGPLGTGVDPIDPSDLNQPSIAVGALAGEQTITRSVTADKPGLYVGDVNVPGFKAKVRPKVLFFNEEGQTKEFTVTLTRKSAELDTYSHGTLTWRGAGLGVKVESPIVAKPVAVAAPPEVSGSGASGELSYDVTSGVDGDIDVELHGLVGAEVTDGTLTPGEPADTAGNASSQLVEFDVPEGTTLARFDLVSAQDNADYDMYIFGPDGSLISQDGVTGAASERVDLADPEAGTHFALVHMFASSDGSAVDFSLRNFAVGSAAVGNATVSPDPIPGQLAEESTVTVSWSGLDTSVPYLGTITYEGLEQPTVVTVE